MASGYRKKDSTIISNIVRDAHEYEFYQLAHLLEGISPDYASLGEGIEPSDEAIRFSGNFNLGFPSTDIQKAHTDDKEENPFQILVNFFGLGGVFGPLPISYTGFILERYWQKDKAISRFLDNFNHRLISLIYRVIKAHKPASDGTSPEKERFALNIFSILGLGSDFLKNRMSMPDRAILNYSGIFSCGTSSSRGLESILTSYFEFPVAISPLRGDWGLIPRRQWTYIGMRLGRNHRLGRSFLLGTKAWLQQSKFMVDIGPLGFTQYLDILPMGEAFKPLCECVKYYAGQEFDFDIVATLKRDEVPKVRLGGKTTREDGFNIIGGPRLSWSFILRSSRKEADEDTVVSLSGRLNNDDYFAYLGNGVRVLAIGNRPKSKKRTL